MNKYINNLMLVLYFTTSLFIPTLAYAVYNSDLQIQIENIRKSNLELSNRIDSLEHNISSLLNQVELIINSHNESIIIDGYRKNSEEEKRSLKLEQEYNYAIDLFKKEKYVEAENQFSILNETYKDNTFVNEIKFYRGVCKYKFGKYKESIEQLDEFIKNNQSKKIPEALMIVADSQLAMNDRTGAIETIKIILNNHKDSEIYSKARKRLKMIE